MNKIISIIKSSIEAKKRIISNDLMIESINLSSDILVSAFKNGNKVLFCGNGGSAADAQHLAAELSGRFYFDRPALNAEALHCNTSYKTAISNDYHYDKIYSRLVEGTCNKGDVLIGLSTSGNSKNVINAFKAARKKGMVTISFTGNHGGDLRPLSDIIFDVPSQDTPRIQECHIMIGHIICQLVEEKFFNK